MTAATLKDPRVGIALSRIIRGESTRFFGQAASSGWSRAALQGSCDVRQVKGLTQETLLGGLELI